MFISDLPAGNNGAYGTATARARQKNTEGERLAAAEQQAREARVAELRRQYLAGTYQVDTAELSAAIIKHHLDQDA